MIDHVISWNDVYNFSEEPIFFFKCSDKNVYIFCSAKFQISTSIKKKKLPIYTLNVIDDL